MSSTQATAVSIAVFVAALTAAVAAGPAGGAAVSDPGPSVDGTADRAPVQSGAPNLTIRTGARVEFADLESTTAVRREVATGRLRAEANFTVGDPFVVQISHAGLADRLGDGNATDRALDLFDRSAVNVSFEETTYGPNRLPVWIDPRSNGTRVFVDAANDTTYLVVDSDRADVVYSDWPGPQVDRTAPDSKHPADLSRYDEFRVNVTMSGESDVTAGDETVSATRDFGVRIRTAHLPYDDEQRERIYVDPAPNQTLRGVTNIRPGLNVTVTLRTDFSAVDSEEWVARRTTATVAEDGTFSAAFDLSDVPNGTVANASVRFDDRNILHRDGYDPPETTVVVTAPAGTVEVLETERNASGTYDAVTVDATLSRGGFVVLHRGSATGPVAGVSGYLAAGSHEAVPVYVGEATDSTDPLIAVVHRDGNQNHWFDNASVDDPYATRGTATAETGFAPESPAPTTSTPAQTTAAQTTPTSTAEQTLSATTTPVPTPERTTGLPTSSPGPTATTQSSQSTGAPPTGTAGSSPTAGPRPGTATTSSGAGPGFGVAAALLAGALLATGRLVAVRSRR